MKKLLAASLVCLLAAQPALAGDDKGHHKSGLSMHNLEKGLQSAGQGISKGARESGIEGGLRRAGTDIKNAGKAVERKIGEGARKSKSRRQ